MNLSVGKTDKSFSSFLFVTLFLFLLVDDLRLSAAQKERKKARKETSTVSGKIDVSAVRNLG